MQRLTSIADLQTDGWQNLMPQVSWLGDLYEEFKKHDVDRRFITAEFGGDEDRSHGVHASEVSGCMRRLVYSLMYTEKKNDAKTTSTNMRRRFQLGHLLHGLTQSDFDRMCWMTNGLLEYEPEVRIGPEFGGLAQQYDVHSHCDGVFTYHNANGEPYLRIGTEIKTKSDPEFEKLKKPEQSHLEQACIYMKMLDLPLMWFFYYNKSNSNWTKPSAPYLIAFDHQLWARLENRINAAYDHKNRNELPKREEGKPCEWCSYAWHCKPTYLQRQQAWSKKRQPPKPGEFRR